MEGKSTLSNQEFIGDMPRNVKPYLAGVRGMAGSANNLQNRLSIKLFQCHHGITASKSEGVG